MALDMMCETSWRCSARGLSVNAAPAQPPSHRSRGLSKSSQNTSPRGRTQVRVAAQASWSTVDVEQGKTMLDRQGYKFLDLRSEREFDYERLTKPARCSINVPLFTASDDIDPNFQSRVAANVPRTAKLLVVRMMYL